MGCQSGYKFGISECCLISNYSLSIPTQISGTWIDEVANTEVIATGGQHSAAIKTDGTLWLWGNGNAGRLGDNTTLNKSSPVQTVSGGTNWCQVSLGDDFSAAIKTDGTLWLWGNAANGKLGDNTTAARSSPVQTISGGNNWCQVSAGRDHTGAIKTDGTLWMWGQSADGRLGNNNTAVDMSSPVQTVAGGNNWKQVSAGLDFTAAIKTDGTLWTWGDGANGKLGDNTVTISKSSPVQTVSGGTNWKQVVASASEGNIAAIKTDGTLWLWGNGGTGRLGNNLTISQSSPVQTVSGGTNWKEAQLTETAIATKTDGTLWSWGRNLNGALGDGTEILSISSPAQIALGITDWRQISIEGTSVLATRSNCTLYGWGLNSLGQLAFDLITDCGMQMKPYDFDDVFVRKEFFSEGGLWAWGIGTCGRLGRNNVVSSSSPVQTISGGTNWKQVSNKGTSMAAIKSDGSLWLWGLNADGQIGTNTIVSASSPVQTVSAGTNWKQVDIGFTNVTAAIKNDGTLWLWGSNTNGKLGNNNTVNRSSPVQTVSGGTNWKQVSAGCENVAAIKTDGTLWLWGGNANGQLGVNTILSVSSPVQTISGGTNWKQVSLGRASGIAFALAIKTDGTLWGWGGNANGQIGTASTIDFSSPVQTVSGGTNWKEVLAGGASKAIKSDGTLWSWGANNAGQAGDNTIIDRSSPVQTVSAGTNWKSLGNSNDVSAAIKTDGTLWLWGCGTDGRIGDNTAINKSSPVQTVSAGTNWKQVSGGSNSLISIREDCW